MTGITSEKNVQRASDFETENHQTGGRKLLKKQRIGRPGARNRRKVSHSSDTSDVIVVIETTEDACDEPANVSHGDDEDMLAAQLQVPPVNPSKAILLSPQQQSPRTKTQMKSKSVKILDEEEMTHSVQGLSKKSLWLSCIERKFIRFS